MKMYIEPIQRASQDNCVDMASFFDDICYCITA